MDQVWGYSMNVHDGDTFEMEITSQARANEYPYKQRERVRLAEINAPELQDRAGGAAADQLEQALSGRRLRIEIHTRDIYGRLIADVHINISTG